MSVITSSRGCLHLTIGSSNNNNSSVHVCGTSNHVLDVIGVTGTVDVGIVAGIGRVLDVSGGNGDTTLSLFGSFINGTVFEEVGETFFSLALGDGGSQGSLELLELLN